jgi:hypothetical protein
MFTPIDKKRRSIFCFVSFCKISCVLKDFQNNLQITGLLVFTTTFNSILIISLSWDQIVLVEKQQEFPGKPYALLQITYKPYHIKLYGKYIERLATDMNWTLVVIGIDYISRFSTNTIWSQDNDIIRILLKVVVNTNNPVIYTTYWILTFVVCIDSSDWFYLSSTWKNNQMFTPIDKKENNQMFTPIDKKRRSIFCFVSCCKFHEYLRISVLVKVNGIPHYSFIDLILPCFNHK